MSLVLGLLFGAFLVSLSLIVIPILFPKVFFRVINKIIDRSEGNPSLSDW